MGTCLDGTCLLYINLPVSDIVRLPHPPSGNTQGQETFLAPSADKQTCNYGTECSNHHLSPSTLRSKGLSRSKMKWWAIYTNLPVSDIVGLPHPRSGDSQGQETFLAPSSDKQTRNYDTGYLNQIRLKIARAYIYGIVAIESWPE